MLLADVHLDAIPELLRLLKRYAVPVTVFKLPPHGLMHFTSKCLAALRARISSGDKIPRSVFQVQAEGGGGHCRRLTISFCLGQIRLRVCDRGWCDPVVATNFASII